MSCSLLAQSLFQRLPICKEVWVICTSAIVVERPREDPRQVLADELFLEHVAHANRHIQNVARGVLCHYVGRARARRLANSTCQTWRVHGENPRTPEDAEPKKALNRV